MSRKSPSVLLNKFTESFTDHSVLVLLLLVFFAIGDRKYLNCLLSLIRQNSDVSLRSAVSVIYRK